MRLLRVNTVARRLGVTDSYVRWLVRQGKLDYIRESPRKTFILESSLEAYQERIRSGDVH
jgi:excisionase family DNA binding protein